LESGDCLYQKKRLWNINPVLYLTVGVLFAVCTVSLFWNWRIAAAEYISAVVISILIFAKRRSFKHDMEKLMLETAHGLGAADIYALETFPLPVAVVSHDFKIIWYNNIFRSSVISGKDCYGNPLKSIIRGINKETISHLSDGIDVTYNEDINNVQNSAGLTKPASVRKYTVFGTARQDDCYTLYFIDNTSLKDIAEEYANSKPIVAVIMIDSYDELMQNAKEGEKTEVVSMIEKLLTAWVSQTTGFLRHSDRDKYLFIFEERFFKKIVETRFDILDKVRKITVGDYMSASLSIGVGRGGKSLAENEEMARQALDMALGRGGDQAAVRNDEGGYVFYGGTAKAVEKRTKAKSRIIASALSELIDSSDNVLIMGHKATDVDFVGAAAAIYKAATLRGCDARIVLSKKTSLAKRLITKLEDNGFEEAFIEPEDSLFLVTPKTLLIIADTHCKGYVEYPELYKVCKTVMVIDHHRKMVDFIDNAVIFYHEPYASSTSEMVTELMQYIADKSVSKQEASALLAGITLDTRNFCVRTGVRTFEAAAYLRRKGADTAWVRELFSESIGDYKLRAELVASAEIKNNCAIVSNDNENFGAMRFIAPQAADELLSISGVWASFVVYRSENGVSVSARSMGRINVQLVLEKMGGGGHMTMAGVQISGKTVAQVTDILKDAIDKYLTENSAEDKAAKQ
jgi:c-di-AMP phosphodiesterase-like protein